jgi:hypothetical protein
LRLLPPLLLAPLLPPLALLTLPRVLHPLWPVLLTLPRALLTLPRARWALPKRQSRNNRFSGLEKATFGWLFFVWCAQHGRTQKIPQARGFFCCAQHGRSQNPR